MTVLRRMFGITLAQSATWSALLGEELGYWRFFVVPVLLGLAIWALVPAVGGAR